MTMTKDELSSLLKRLNIPVGEGEHFLEAKGQYPKVAYWEYVWEDDMASGDDYEELVTYQVSFASTHRRDPALVMLKRLLNDEYRLHPVIYHEYVRADGGSNGPGYYHSYFSLQVYESLESLEDQDEPEY